MWEDNPAPKPSPEPTNPIIIKNNDVTVRTVAPWCVACLAISKLKNGSSLHAAPIVAPGNIVASVVAYDSPSVATVRRTSAARGPPREFFA